MDADSRHLPCFRMAQELLPNRLANPVLASRGRVACRYRAGGRAAAGYGIGTCHGSRVRGLSGCGRTIKPVHGGGIGNSSIRIAGDDAVSQHPCRWYSDLSGDWHDRRMNGTRTGGAQATAASLANGASVTHAQYSDTSNSRLTRSPARLVRSDSATAVEDVALISRETNDAS